MNTDNWSEDDKLFKMRPMPLSTAENHPCKLNTVFIQLILDKFKHSLAEILWETSKEDLGEAYITRIMQKAYDFVGVELDEDRYSFSGIRPLHSDHFPIIVIDCQRTVYWDDITYIGFVFYNGYTNYELFLGEEVIYATFIMRASKYDCTITEYFENQETEYKTHHEAMVEEFIFYIKESTNNKDI